MHRVGSELRAVALALFAEQQAKTGMNSVTSGCFPQSLRSQQLGSVLQFGSPLKMGDSCLAKVWKA